MTKSLTTIALIVVAVVFAVTQVHAYDITQRWTNTKTDGGGNSRGDPLTLLWSVVPDGEGWSRGGPSDLIDYLDVGWNVSAGNRVPDLTNRPWWAMMDRVYDQYERVSGLTLTYEPEQNPDGSDAGASGDIRIGGVPFTWENDKGGVLADNAFPQNGDMRIDTYRGSNGVPSFFHTNPAAFRNLISHESGHGVGLSHSDISGANSVMETPLETSFWGLQFDDVYAFNRMYGDPLEKNGGNDTSSTAYDFGRIDPGGSAVLGLDAQGSSVNEMDDDWVGIDGNSDEDWFTFFSVDPFALDVTVSPMGPSYTTQEQGNFNAKERSDLNFQIVDSNGSSVLTTVDATNIGGIEEISGFSLSAGRYYIKIDGENDLNQFYKLELEVSSSVPKDLTWVGRFSNNWETQGENNFTEGLGFTFYRSFDNLVFNNSGESLVNIPSNVSAGSIEFNASFDYQLLGAGGIITGEVAINGSGSVEFSNSGNSYSGPTDVNSGKLIVTTATGTGTTTVAAGATIAGSGTIQGDLENSGDIEPGDSAGTLSVLGNATLEPSSVLSIELGPSDHDLLDVTGILSLSGELSVSLIDGLTPSAGQSYDILDFGSAFGEFETFDLPVLATGLYWNTSALVTTGELLVAEGLQGDFDQDGDVDGLDFLHWQIGEGTLVNATVADGDADFDGDVDDADYQLWQTNYGITLGESVVAGLLGDFNEDGNVDGLDLLLWQVGEGMESNATLADGDADLDGDVDQDDYQIWQTYYGLSQSSAIAAVVPEPNACLLLAVGLLSLSHRRK